MTPGSRARFVAAYTRLVADVWADPAKELLLDQDPRALVAEYDIEVSDPVTVEVIRDVGDAEPDLDQQVELWQRGLRSGHLVLVVPALDPISDIELADHELDDVVAGLNTSCACCCPCCCTS
jgi:uncharacterized protein YheU (UPF0270 family)